MFYIELEPGMSQNRAFHSEPEPSPKFLESPKLSVSQHKHKITSLSKFGLNRSLKLQENAERKIALVIQNSVLSERNKKLLARSLLLF